MQYNVIKTLFTKTGQQSLNLKSANKTPDYSQLSTKPVKNEHKQIALKLHSAFVV